MSRPSHPHACRPLTALVSIVAASALVVAVVCGWLSPVGAAGGVYSDGPTADWFRSLMVPGTTHGCCDQADCHPAPATFVSGQWLAESKVYPGEWVPIPADRVLMAPSIFGEQGVLCESDHKNGDDAPIQSLPSGKDVWVYCFAPPPQFF
jgi:hypothetical protein